MSLPSIMGQGQALLEQLESLQPGIPVPRLQAARASNQNVVVGNTMGKQCVEDEDEGIKNINKNNININIHRRRREDDDDGDDYTSYVFVQPTPAIVWTINHNLDGFPSVTLVDNSGNVILAQVQYVNDDTIIVTFSQPVAGKAYLNM